METTFERKQSGKHKEITYVTKLNNLTHIHKYKSSVLCSNEKDVDTLIEKVRGLEESISKKIAKEGYPFKTELIIITYFNVIDSIASGIDIRSKMSNEELADRFVGGYKKMYDEAYLFCCDTIRMYDGGEHKETYTKHWKTYDKHNEFVDEYMFNLRKFKDGDFSINLDTLSKKASELAAMFVKQASEENGKSIDDFLREQE